MTPTRVTHRISRQQGALLWRGSTYATVIFDGDFSPSTVAVDSLIHTDAAEEAEK